MAFKKPSLKAKKILLILALLIFIAANSLITKFIVQNVTLGLEALHVSYSIGSFFGFMEDYDKGIIDLEYAQGKMKKEVEKTESSIEVLEIAKVNKKHVSVIKDGVKLMKQKIETLEEDSAERTKK